MAGGVAVYGMTALPEGTGYFDLMSWQLLFVAGIYFGFTPVPKLIKSATLPSWTAICLAVVGTFFVVRRWHFLTEQEWSPYFEWLFHWKRTLPLGCLLDFGAFSAVVYRFRRPLSAVARTSPGRAIAFLGQHSLQVFVWSVAVTMLASGAENRWIEPSPQVLSAGGDRVDSCQLLHTRLVARSMAGPEPRNVRFGFSRGDGQPKPALSSIYCRVRSPTGMTGHVLKQPTSL